MILSLNFLLTEMSRGWHSGVIPAGISTYDISLLFNISIDSDETWDDAWSGVGKNFS